MPTRELIQKEHDFLNAFSDFAHSLLEEERLKCGKTKPQMGEILRKVAIQIQENYHCYKKDKQCFAWNGEFYTPIFKRDFYRGEKRHLGIDSYFTTEAEMKIFNIFSRYCHSDSREVDLSLVLIPLANGMYEVNAKNPKEHKFRDFSPDDKLDFQLPYAYDAAATAPFFQKVLDTILPNKENQALMQEFFGYCLIRNGFIGDYNEEKMLCLYGLEDEGREGFKFVFDYLFGRRLCSDIPIDSLARQEKARLEIAGKILNFSVERKKKFSLQYFNPMISGEPLSVPAPRHLIRHYAKLVAIVFDLPFENEKLWFHRRLFIIPFPDNPWWQKEFNILTSDLWEVKHNELPGVFNWVVAGLDRYLKQGFTDNGVTIATLKQGGRFLYEGNPIISFFRAKGYFPYTPTAYQMTAKNKEQISAPKLYKEFQEWHAKHRADDACLEYARFKEAIKATNAVVQVNRRQSPMVFLRGLPAGRA